MSKVIVVIGNMRLSTTLCRTCLVKYPNDTVCLICGHAALSNSKSRFDGNLPVMVSSCHVCAQFMEMGMLNSRCPAALRGELG